MGSSHIQPAWESNNNNKKKVEERGEKGTAYFGRFTVLPVHISSVLKECKMFYLLNMNLIVSYK